MLKVFETYIHRADVHAEIFKLAEEIEEVVGSQGQFGGSDGAREGEVGSRKCFGESDR